MESWGNCWRASTVFMTWLVIHSEAGCGYARSGQWEDDPGNWERAFGHPAAPEMRVLRSLYWRNPHFTFEGGDYFKVAMNRVEIRKMLSNPDLVRLHAADAPVSGSCAARPGWFTVGDFRDFEVFTWRGANIAQDRIAVHRTRDEVFLSSCQ